MTFKHTERELRPASGSPHVINFYPDIRQQRCQQCGPVGPLTADASAHAAVTGQCPWCLGRGGDTYTHPSLPPGWTCTQCGGNGHRRTGVPLPTGVHKRLAAQQEIAAQHPAAPSGHPVP